MYTFKCLLFALPVVARAGTFGQTDISLAGVKRSCVHIYTLKTTQTKARLKSNTNGIKTGSDDDDVVIIPMHLLIYIFIYQKILPQDRSQICP